MTNKHEQQADGWSHALYPPKQADFYLVKTYDHLYEVVYFDGEIWYMPPTKGILCWMPVPKTDIDSPF